MSEDEDFYYIDDIKVWKKFRAPMERLHVEAIRKAYPDWTLESGPYCPGKAGCLTYRIEKNGVKKFVHVSDVGYNITED